MRGKKALILALIILSSVIQLPLAIGDADWLAGWAHRVEVTIDSGDITGNLVNFPVLLHLSTSSGIGPDDITFIFDEVGANSLKIAVTEDDGLTECKVEIERWNATGEEAWLWVKAPSIAYDVNTTLYLYFDNDHADNNANVGVVGSAPGEAVWDADYLVVLHLSDISGYFNDSTFNDNDFFEVGNGVSRSIQRIDGGVDLLGTNDYLECVNRGIIDGLDQVTLEAFVYLDALLTDRSIISDWGGGDDTIIFQYDFDPANKWRVIFRTPADSAEVVIFGTASPSLFWYNLAVTFERNDFVYGYEDGVQTQGEVIGDSPIRTVNNRMFLGVNRDLSLDLDGKLDEIRISNVTRSHEWLNATYQSNIDDLVDYGEEEEYVDKPMYTPTYLFGAGFNGSAPVVDLYWTSNHTDIDFFEVQNSTDKVTWAYLGQNTTTEYHDLRVINGTQRYYRVRGCNFTDAVWSNSSWSDVNFETVYFVEAVTGGAIPAVVVGATGKYYALAIILLILGLLLGLGMRRRR